MTDGPACPACNSQRVVPIIRGELTREAAEAAARGEAVIGGCMFSKSDPVWFCRDCRNEFGRVDGA